MPLTSRASTTIRGYNGIPVDILDELTGRGRKEGEISVIWSALLDAIELLNMVMDSDRRPNRAFHDVAYLERMMQLERSKAEYERLLRRVIIYGNVRNWKAQVLRPILDLEVKP